MPRTAAIQTLGCKVNSYESELIGESLRRAGWQLSGADQPADLYVINTCTVTREADRQARQAVRRLVRRNPDALVVVTGCYAQMDGEVCARIPGVDLVLGNDRKLDLVRYLPELEQGSLPKIMVGDLNEHVSLPAEMLTGFESRTRAFVQVQQGCNQGCMFCMAVTLQSADPKDFSNPYGKVDTMHSVRLEVRDGERNRVRGPPRWVGEEPRSLTARHQGDQFVICPTAANKLPRDLPIAENRSAVGNLGDLTQAMRYIDDAAAFCRELADPLKEPSDTRRC